MATANRRKCSPGGRVQARKDDQWTLMDKRNVSDLKKKEVAEMDPG